MSSHLSSVNTTQARSLSFNNADLEREFLSYMHPHPVKSLLIVYWAGTLVYIFSSVTVPGVGFEVNAAWWTLAAIAETFIYVAFSRVRHARKDQLLLFERVLWWLTGCFVFAADTRVTLLHYQTCDVLEPTKIDTREAYQYPQCRRHAENIGPITAAIMVLFGILPFTWMVSYGAAVVVIYVAMAVVIPPPDPGFQIGIVVSFAILGLAFVAFVRYDQERDERRSFLEHKRIQWTQMELAERERGLLEYCSMLIPRALLKRSAQLMAGSAVDTQDHAVVVLIGVHDFGVWCTKQQPIEVATTIVGLQLTVRQAADERGADYIGSMGDTTVCTAGLVQPAKKPGHVGCAVVSSVLREDHGRESGVPLRAAVHKGSLRGTFLGEYTARYDVAGPAYRVAREALLECPQNRCVVVDDVFPASSAWFKPDIEHEPVKVHEHRFTVITAIGSTEVNSSDVTGSDQVPSMPSESEPDLAISGIDSSFIPALTSSITKQQPQQQQGVISLSGNTSDQHPAIDMASDESKDTDELQNELEKLQQMGTVWCCFPRFIDEDVEAAFVDERMEQVPHAASRMWFAYALFVFGVLVLLFADFAEPLGPFSVLMLVVAILLALLMGGLPRFFGVERFRRFFFAWSVTAVTLPLLVVYGTALARPSAVGNDPKLYIVIGALVRSYCFASSRWLALMVPIVTLLGLLTYALPGAYIRFTFVFIFFLVLGTVAAERERELMHRRNTRRRVESRLILSKLRSVEKLREGLLRGAVPKEVFFHAKRHRLLNAESDSTATLHDGVVMTVSAAAVTSAGDASSYWAPLRQLHALLAENYRSGLALGAVMGDQALVVGPVVVEAVAADLAQPKAVQSELAIAGCLSIGMALVNGDQGRGALSVLIDYDTVCHVMVLDECSQYFALGVGVTRMLAILASADPATLVGCLLTERVAMLAEELGLLRGYKTAMQGPMKFRGVGMVRFSKLTA